MSPKHQIGKKPRCTSSHSRDVPGSRLSKHKIAALPNVRHATKFLLKVVQCEHGNMGLQRCLLKTTTAVDVNILKLKEIKATVNTNCSALKMLSSIKCQLETSSASGFRKWISAYETLLRSNVIHLVEYPLHPSPTRVPKKNLVLKS